VFWSIWMRSEPSRASRMARLRPCSRGPPLQSRREIDRRGQDPLIWRVTYKENSHYSRPGHRDSNDILLLNSTIDTNDLLTQRRHHPPLFIRQQRQRPLHDQRRQPIARRDELFPSGRLRVQRREKGTETGRGREEDEVVVGC
jgi:hypothetical protein